MDINRQNVRNREGKVEGSGILRRVKSDSIFCTI